MGPPAHAQLVTQIPGQAEESCTGALHLLRMAVTLGFLQRTSSCQWISRCNEDVGHLVTYAAEVCRIVVACRRHGEIPKSSVEVALLPTKPSPCLQRHCGRLLMTGCDALPDGTAQGACGIFLQKGLTHPCHTGKMARFTVQLPDLPVEGSGPFSVTGLPGYASAVEEQFGI